MNWTRYLANLRQGHRQFVADAVGPGAVDQNLNSIVAGFFGLVTLMLVATGGYQVGFEQINDLGLDVSGRFVQTLTDIGDTWLAICLLALLARRRPRVLWMGVIAILYSALLSVGLKSLFHAARPPAVLGDWLIVVGPVLTQRSFPSGHTVTAFVTAACFSVGASKSARILFYSLAAAVGLSRILVGVHWPVDVTAGAAIAGLSVALATRTIKAVQWGLELTPQLFFVSLIAVCAVLELIRAPDYPLAQPLSIVVAVLALSVLAKDYVLGPLLPRRADAA